jgi:hypothetical protein
MKGDFHVPFRGSPGVRFPRATRQVLSLIAAVKQYEIVIK